MTDLEDALRQTLTRAVPYAPRTSEALVTHVETRYRARRRARRALAVTVAAVVAATGATAVVVQNRTEPSGLTAERGAPSARASDHPRRWRRSGPRPSPVSPPTCRTADGTGRWSCSTTAQCSS
ncbi:hypothetical protein ACFQYP_22010 [Nonomuraea antimicrobica]